MPQSFIGISNNFKKMSLVKHINAVLLLTLIIGLHGCRVLDTNAKDQVEVGNKQNCGRAMTQRTKCE